MALVPGERNQFKGKLSCRSDLRYLNAIKDSLRGNSAERFRESCFGHFLDMDPLKFQGQLILHLLFRQDDSKSIDKIVFHIKNKEAEFGKNEFCLITGLQFGPTPELPSELALHLNVFRGKTPLYLIDVEETLKRVVMEENGEGQNSLKLALLYVLYGILIMKDRLSKRIDIRYIHLVDDLEKFNQYPWGSVAFEFLMKALRNCMRGRAASYRGRRNRNVAHSIESFDVNGFTHALQVWAYEVMPVVAQICARPQLENIERILRILRWSAIEFRSFDELKNIISQQIIMEMNLLSLSWSHQITRSMHDGSEIVNVRGKRNVGVRQHRKSHNGRQRKEK